MLYQKRVTIPLALLSIVALLLILNACSGSTDSLESTAAAAVENLSETAEQVEGEINETAGEAEQEHEIHWSYEGEGGPEHWGELSEENKACGNGDIQSPIDISGAATADLPNIIFNYSATPVTIFNNGHTIQVNYTPGSSITLDGKGYNLEQFHFHAPSEHAINGQLADAEMHLVHKLSDTEYAVIGLMIKSGAENPAFNSFWNEMPTTITEKDDIPQVTPIPQIEFNAADIIPEGSAYYTYPGSLTTPPCSEVVKWLVLTTPIEMSLEQIEDFKAIINDNNRPIQELNGRSPQEDNTP